MGKNKDIPDGPALQQGAGLTEDDELAGLRDVGVQIIQNQLCYEKFAALSRKKLNRIGILEQLGEGINLGMLCTLGIVNEDGVLQVLLSNDTF